MAPPVLAAIGTFIVNAAINIAISYGVGVLISKLTKKQIGQDLSQGGAVLQVQYGEETPEVIACGLVCSAGTLRYDNTFDNNNKMWQRVLELSSWYSTSLERVAVNGEWVTLGTDEYLSDRGQVVTSGYGANRIWIKFLDGTQSAVDAWLGANDNPAGRWGASHIGAGLTYAIVTMRYNRDEFNQPPELRFEFKGAPLYDWRLDTTAGGSGAHRWNDVTTWEWSANPILMDYCYRRGGFSFGGETVCGMALTSDQLPLTQYTTAANICDETVSSQPRYRCSIFLDATRQHRDNLEDVLLSCSGMNVDGISVVYPLINAAQTPVATISRADVVDGEDYEFDRDGSFGDVINTVNGTYTAPNLVYEATGYTKQEATTGVTLDRRTLDSTLNFPMVTSKRQAQQLASIYLSETRFPATKTCTLAPKWMVLDVGDWITWDNDDDGVDRDYQIISMVVNDYENNVPRGVKVTLRERSDDIYDGIGAVAEPTKPTSPGAPTVINEVPNFAAIAWDVVGTSGEIFPAIRASWDAFDDVTVSQVALQWRPKLDPNSLFQTTVEPDQTVFIIQEGIVASTVYEVRTRLIATAFRTTTWSAWTEVTTNARNFDFTVDFSDLEADIENTLVQFRADLDRLNQWTVANIAEAMIGNSEGQNELRIVQEQIADSQALILENKYLAATETSALAGTVDALAARVGTTESLILDERTSRASGDQANATALTSVSARADAGSASGLIKLEATTAPSGVTARWGVYLRTSVEGSYNAEAAEYLEIKDGTTRKVIRANQTVIVNDAGTVLALFDTNGNYLNNARIVNLTAANIQAGSITGTEIAAGAITAAKITAGTITANEIVASGITTFHSQTWDGTTDRTATSYVAVGNTLTINVPSGAAVLILASVSGGAAGPSAWRGYIARDGSQLGPIRFMPPIVVSSTYRINNILLTATDAPSAGNHAYTVYFSSDGSGDSVTTRSVYLYGLVFRR